MKNLSFSLPVKSAQKNVEGYLLGIILMLIWYSVPKVFAIFDSTIGTIDQSIWMLVVLSFICSLMTVGLSWFLLKWTWSSLGLPVLRVMVLQFKDLELWIQLGFFFASFCLLVLAGTGALIAVL